MCSVSLSLDNSLMEKVRPVFPSNESLLSWMSSQMESLIRGYLNNVEQPSHRCGCSDEELDHLFAGRPDFDGALLSDCTKEDFRVMARSHAKRNNKNIEKWL